MPPSYKRTGFGSYIILNMMMQVVYWNRSDIQQRDSERERGRETERYADTAHVGR